MLRSSCTIAEFRNRPLKHLYSKYFYHIVNDHLFVILANKFRGTVPIRDVQFNPHEVNQLAAGGDSGDVFIWDIRGSGQTGGGTGEKQNVPLRQFSAHGGPVLCLDFHPSNKVKLLATGGRDKLIKVSKQLC